MEFYDTYAFIETVVSGKIHFSEEIITLSTNLAEVYYRLLILYNEKTANHFYEKVIQVTTEVPIGIVKEAMLFRLANKKKKFSYIDALGYTYARKNKLSFVTGDKTFKGLPGVKIIG